MNGTHTHINTSCLCRVNPQGGVARVQITSGFRTGTMYVSYITIEIYFLVCTNILLPLYFLCITSMPHRFPSMDFTHKLCQNCSRLKSQSPSQFYFMKLCTSYNNLFSSSEGVSKSHKQSFVY